MGIPGLTKYTRTNVTPERVNLTQRSLQLNQKIVLAVDVSALSYHLACNKRAIPYHTGGCYVQLAQATTNFVTQLRARGIELRGIVDGLAHEEKSLTTLSRLYDAFQHKKETMRQFTQYGRNASVFQNKGPFIKPPLLHETVISALKQCNVPLICAQREADDLLAHSARPDGGSCHAILSNDSDFLVYNTGPLILFDDITIVDPNEEFPNGYMVVRMYTRDKVAATLGIAPALMPVVASLVGTDSTPPKQEIHHRLSAINKSKGKKSYNKTDVVVQAGRYIKDFTIKHPDLVPGSDNTYDIALASSLFGGVVSKKSSGKRGGNKKGKGNKKNSKNKKNSVSGHGIDRNMGGQSLVNYLHVGRTRYEMTMSIEEWNSKLTPKHWSSFHNCEYDRHLTEILIDQHFTWGRPPLESLDSYMLCLPIRERLYTYLFGNEDVSASVTSNTQDSDGGSMSSTTSSTSSSSSPSKLKITNKETLLSMVTSFADAKVNEDGETNTVEEESGTIVYEYRRVRKKKMNKPTPVQVQDFGISIQSKSTSNSASNSACEQLGFVGMKKNMTLNHVLFGTQDGEALGWIPTKDKYNGTLATLMVKVLATICEQEEGLKRKVNSALFTHVHKLLTKR